jgi:hypothetical protein
MMMDGILPLIGLVSVINFLDLFVSIMFALTYIIMETNYWYIFIPMPIIEFAHTCYLLWELFMRSTSKLLYLKTALFLLSFLQALLFQGFH